MAKPGFFQTWMGLPYSLVLLLNTVGYRAVLKRAPDFNLRQRRVVTALVANAGRVLTQRQLLREVWGPAHSEQSHYLRVYMGHLRTKLEVDPAQPQHLLTETAVGYRLVA